MSDNTASKKQVGYSGGQIASMYSYDNPSVISIFNHKLGGKHKKDILAGLAILGPSTVYSLSKYVIEAETEKLNFKFKSSKSKKLKAKGISKRKDTYYKIINDRHDDGKLYPGLVSKGFVGHASPSKKDLYFLTLKGCILSLGFKFGDDNLRTFIKNAASTHIFFAYVNKVLQNTSLEFINEIFIKPIKGLIEKNKINFDEEIESFFSNISESIGNALSSKIENIYKKLKDEDRIHDVTSVTDLAKFKEIKFLMNNTWYEIPTQNHRWEMKIHNYFYQKEQINFQYLGEEIFIDIQGFQLTWRIMREIHFAYYHSTNSNIPNRHQQKFPKM